VQTCLETHITQPQVRHRTGLLSSMFMEVLYLVPSSIVCGINISKHLIKDGVHVIMRSRNNNFTPFGGICISLMESSHYAKQRLSLPQQHGPLHPHYSQCEVQNCPGLLHKAECRAFEPDDSQSYDATQETRQQQGQGGTTVFVCVCVCVSVCVCKCVCDLC